MPKSWRAALEIYRDRRQLIVLLQGFGSGIPLLLVYATLSARLAQAGVSRTSIGLLLLVQLPYNFKFLWAPLLDQLPPPLRLGQRRGWAITIQAALMAAILAMGWADPKTQLGLLAALGLLVAFLSASQDIIVDAFRIELLPAESQGAGAAVYQAGYRVAMLAAGAGALSIASVADWFWAYGAMAALVVAGMAAFLLAEEPAPRPKEEHKSFAQSFRHAVIDPFADFMQRAGWLAILVFVPLYKLGEAMAGAMAKPFYISLGYSLGEIARMSSLVAFVTTVTGGFLGGIAVARWGLLRAVILCGILQSIGNLFYVLLGSVGHMPWVLALSAGAEDITGGMAGTAIVAFLSRLTRPPYTATQYALLASFMVVGRNFFSASGGALSEALGWTPFFLVTTVVTLPALVLVWWIARRWPKAFLE